jgi:hypothetical protein
LRQSFTTIFHTSRCSDKLNRTISISTIVMAAPISKIDRQTTTPFYLKLFYRNGGFHR